jgi:hypothetical protein
LRPFSPVEEQIRAKVHDNCNADRWTTTGHFGGTYHHDEWRSALIARSLLSVVLAAATTGVMAGPRQIDVLGLVPGVADEEAVAKASGSQSAPDGTANLFVIGGHEMLCKVSYVDSRLSRLGCYTGVQATTASNQAVFAELLVGFSKKLGKPDSSTKESIRTRAGVPHERRIVRWIDTRGNRLTLFSIYDRVDAGYFLLESADQRRQDAAESSAREASKKF